MQKISFSDADLKPRLTVEQLQALRKRLPKKDGTMGKIAASCACSKAKVSQVFKGVVNDPIIIETARLFAEEYEKSCQALADAVGV